MRNLFNRLLFEIKAARGSWLLLISLLWIIATQCKSCARAANHQSTTHIIRKPWNTKFRAIQSDSTLIPFYGGDLNKIETTAKSTCTWVASLRNVDWALESSLIFSIKFDEISHLVVDNVVQVSQCIMSYVKYPWFTWNKSCTSCGGYTAGNGNYELWAMQLVSKPIYTEVRLKLVLWSPDQSIATLCRFLLSWRDRISCQLLHFIFHFIRSIDFPREAKHHASMSSMTVYRCVFHF